MKNLLKHENGSIFRSKKTKFYAIKTQKNKT